ncbi:hypothetical protein DMENIID0001_117610 [Sergentomyia squamirostris]
MYGMTQTTALPSSSPTPGAPSILPMVRKVRAPMTAPIRSSALPEMRAPAPKNANNLHSYRGQKWSNFLEQTDSLRDIEKPDDRDQSGGHVMRLDGAEMAVYGVCPETDRFTAVVCHFCGSVVKPQALQAHINRHASDPSTAASIKVIWPESKNWVSAYQRYDGSSHTDTTDDVSTMCLDKQLKPPMTATACMSGGLSTMLQHGTSPSKGTTAPSHPDTLESLDAILQSDHFVSNTAKVSPISGRGSRGRGRQVGNAREREYDPDRHCGVAIESGKPCTRTLTCKSHALSLRRQVAGRSFPFDKLLVDHRNSRAAKIRTNVSGVQPDADSSNSSSSFDIERKSMSGASSSNSSSACGVHLLSPARHGEDTAEHDTEDNKISIKLQDCSVTLNKLKREHTSTALSGASKAKKQRDHSPRSSHKSSLISQKPPVRMTQSHEMFSPPSVEFSQIPLGESSLVTSLASSMAIETNQVECPPPFPPDTLVETSCSQAMSLRINHPIAEQQLTVAVPLSMISVMNLSGSQCAEPEVMTPCSTAQDSGLFTLSNRSKRDLQRSKLHLLRRPGGKSEESDASSAEPIEEFPDIDTWHSAIPRPCQVNCMRLRRVGGGTILSRRFCNFRKALLANMSSTNTASTSGSTMTGSSSVGAVASLLSGRSGVSGSSTKHTIYLDKVNFSGERIKV